MARRSRLSRNFQRKSRNTLILSILGIAAVLFLLFRYGLPLISDASFLFGRITSKPNQIDKKNSEDEEFVPVPNIDSLPKATNNQTVTVTGTSLSGLFIDLYLNGDKEDTEGVDENGEFEFSLDLSEGENIIKVRARKENEESEFSNSVIVIYKKGGPELSIESPGEGVEIKGANPIEVKGKTDSDSSVLVNDFQAITNSEGNWSYYLTLKGGDNEIKVVATDLAGNKTEKIIHANYSQ